MTISSRFIRRLRYLFMPRGPVYVSPRKVAKAALLLTIPAGTILAVLMLYGIINLTQAAMLVAGMYIVHIPLIWPYISNLSALTHYVQQLANDRKALAPDLSFISNVEELSTAVVALQNSWEKRRNLLEAMVSESKILIDSLPDVLILLDDKKQIVRTNSTAKMLFGGDRVNERLNEIIRDPEVVAALAVVELTKRGHTIEYHLEDQARDYLVRIEKFPTFSPGGIAVIIAMHEVTEMKRTEQMFTDFVANASHEIRTPLASMMGFIETLQGPAKDDEKAREEFLKIMGEQAHRMANLVKDLLSLSEIEKNVTTRPTTRINIREVLEEVCRLNAWTAKERGITIKLESIEALPEVVGDKNELGRVLTNLVINATKYGYENSTITVSAETVVGGIPPEMAENVKTALMVAVKDEGEGIAAEHLPRLTERFYRVDKARSRKIGGTGLGLAIVRRILDRHGGAMTIASTEGVGSVFTIYLPLS